MKMFISALIVLVMMSGCSAVIPVITGTNLVIYGVKANSKANNRYRIKLSNSDKATFQNFTLYKFDNQCWKAISSDNKDVDINKECTELTISSKDFISGELTKTRITPTGLVWKGPQQTFRENYFPVTIKSGRETITFVVNNKYGGCHFPKINNHTAMWIQPCESMEIEIRHTHNRKAVYNRDCKKFCVN